MIRIFLAAAVLLSCGSCAVSVPPPVIEAAQADFTATGTWEEIGYQIGSYEGFKNVLRTGKRFWSDKTAAYCTEIEKLIPADIMDQMKGMAKGLSADGKMSYDDAWKAVVAWNLIIDMCNLPRGCSAFAVRSRDGRMFLAHNTDGPKQMSGGTLIMFKPKGGYGFISYYGPQFVGVPLGANEKGLAIVYNVAKQKQPLKGLPVLMMNRSILSQCASYDEAVKMITDFRAGGNRFGPSAANMVIVDFKSHRMGRIEMASDRIEIKEDARWVSATNHYINMPENILPLPQNQRSIDRLNRLDYLLENTVDYTIEALLDILSDHSGQATGDAHTLCVHTDAKENLYIQTVSTQIFDSDFNVYLSVGNPCESMKYNGLKKVSWFKTTNSR